MKQLLISSDSFLPRWDGIARFLIEILPYVAEEFETSCVVPCFKGRKPKLPKVKLIRFPLSRIKIADYVFAKPEKKKLKELIQQADIVWTHTIGPIGRSTILLSSKLKKPVISYVHSVEWELFSRSLRCKHLRSPVYTLTKMYAAWIYNKTKLVMLPTLEMAELMKKNRIKTSYKIVFLGVNTSKFKPPGDKAKAKESIGLSSKERIVGYIGRIGREKDLVTLYRAYLRLRTKLGNTKLLIVGSGVRDWEHLFSSKKDIIRIESKNDILKYYQALDVYVLPSLTETTSLSTMEAMACGVPVVVTKVGHLRDYVTHGVNGFFFEKQNPYQLSKLLEKLFRDDTLREQLSRAARSTIASMYSFEKTANDVLSVLRSF